MNALFTVSGILLLTGAWDFFSHLDAQVVSCAGDRISDMQTCFFIVQQRGYQDRAYAIEDDDLIIGRGNNAQLRLPNVSVSRRHLQLARQRDRYVVVDLGSNNGVTLNGKPLQKGRPHPLQPKDSLQVGIFKLTFLIQSGRSVPVWKGQFINQLARYRPTTTEPQTAATFGLDKGTLLRMAESEHRLESARLVQLGDAARTWTPGDREVLLGRNNQIPVIGLLVAAKAARVYWNDRHHIIEALSWWTTVKVNGDAISGSVPLRSGSRIRIGRSVFRYEEPPSERLEALKGRQTARRETVQIPTSPIRRPASPPPEVLEDDDTTEEITT